MATRLRQFHTEQQLLSLNNNNQDNEDGSEENPYSIEAITEYASKHPAFDMTKGLHNR